MELNELKEIWIKENKQLENMKLNERILRKINLEKTIGEFDKLLNLSILGRNLALVYCFISLSLACMIIKEMAYSIPAIIGGLAMLGSFVSHLSLQKPDHEVSLIELQKSICKFRIHTNSNAKYDAAIVSLWLLTLLPLVIKVVFNLSIYSITPYLLSFISAELILIALLLIFSRKVYQTYNQKLKQSEAYLEKIIEFEEP